jgi:carbonic anhydrase
MSEGMNIRELAEHTSRENVRLQLEHLREFPCVIQREKRGELKLHGWFLQIQNTELWELNEATGAWELVG